MLTYPVAEPQDSASEAAARWLWKLAADLCVAELLELKLMFELTAAE